MTDEHDVFDLAELCWHLAEEKGWTGQQIADELGWEREAHVTRYKQIKERLCPAAWDLSRGLPKNCELVSDDYELVGNRVLPIGNWLESHFRTFLKHLSWSDGDDIAAKNQVEVVEACQKRYKDKDKVTAQWIGDIANRYGWYTELEKYVLENLSSEVPEEDKTGLIESVYANCAWGQVTPTIVSVLCTPHPPGVRYLESIASMQYFRVPLTRLGRGPAAKSQQGRAAVHPHPPGARIKVTE